MKEKHENNKGDGDSVEKSWEHWKQFSNFTEHKDFTEGEGLQIIAWILHSFSFIFLGNETQEAYWNLVDGTPNGGEKIDWICPDLFAFIFITVQHSINRWHNIYKKIVAERAATNNHDIPPVIFPKTRQN